MPRPPKCRKVGFIPQQTYFRPIGPAGGSFPRSAEVVLSVEEVEALRLRDREGLEQEAGALRMAVSRSTFQRLLTSARTKVADALVNGKAIRVAGGFFAALPIPSRCGDCGYEWEAVPAGGAPVCPRCASRNIYCQDCRRKSGSRGWGRCGRGQCKHFN